MKIYTKTGDEGQTSLFGGRRVSKDEDRVVAYGTLDELNSFVGLLYDHCAVQEVKAVLHEVQHRLFSLGAHLAADPERMPLPADLRQADIELLEQEMDRMDAHLEPLKNFILPGGHPVVSYCHICRTITRRAERLVVTVAHHAVLDPLALQYLNRLSDYFFVLARYMGHVLKVEEHIWQARKD